MNMAKKERYYLLSGTTPICLPNNVPKDIKKCLNELYRTKDIIEISREDFKVISQLYSRYIFAICKQIFWV